MAWITTFSDSEIDINELFILIFLPASHTVSRKETGHLCIQSEPIYNLNLYQWKAFHTWFTESSLSLSLFFFFFFFPLSLPDFFLWLNFHRAMWESELHRRLTTRRIERSCPQVFWSVMECFISIPVSWEISVTIERPCTVNCFAYSEI